MDSQRAYTPSQLLSVTWDLFVTTFKRHPTLFLFFILLGPISKSLLGILITFFGNTWLASVGVLFLNVIILTCSILGTLTFIFLLRDRYEEREKIIHSVPTDIRVYFFPYVFLSIHLFFIVTGGSFFFIIPGIFFSIWFMFSWLVLLYEGKKGKEALVRSKEYIKGHIGSVLLNNFLLGILFYLPVGACLLFARIIPIPFVATSFRILTWVLTIVSQTLWIISSVAQFENLRQLRGEFVTPPISPSIKIAFFLGKIVQIIVCGFIFLYLLASILLLIFPGKSKRSSSSNRLPITTTSLENLTAPK